MRDFANAKELFKALIITWIHVAATDRSEGEDQSCVGKAIAESRDPETVVNADEITL
jgi:hypothetical protein